MRTTSSSRPASIFEKSKMSLMMVSSESADLVTHIGQEFTFGAIARLAFSLAADNAELAETSSAVGL